MAVSILVRAEPAQEGVVPFSAHHHLRQVADLVSAVFANELDADGRSALREMQMAGRLSPFLGSLLSSFWFEGGISGYVWVQAGRVIGNVTLQRAEGAGNRWRISNVAVWPEYRRRGIAYQLMLAALREVALSGGGWVLLQVRADNVAARHLYEKLGFTSVCQEGIWKLAASPAEPAPPDPSVPLCRLPAIAWRERLELARAARSELATWAEDLNPADYRVGLLGLGRELFGKLTGFGYVERWGLREKGRLLAAVETWISGLADAHRMRFVVHPTVRGQVEKALVAQGLWTLAEAPSRAVIVRHDGDHSEGVAALEAAGFRAQRILVTMRRKVTPAEARL